MRLEQLGFRAAKVVTGLLGGGAGIAAVAIVCWQITEWLKTATWNTYTIADALRDWGMPYPFTPHLLGVQKIIDATVAWPAVVAYAVIAIVSALLSLWAMNAEHDLERAEQNKQNKWSGETLPDIAQEFEELIRRR